MGETIKCPFYISHNQKQRNVQENVQGEGRKGSGSRSQGSSL